MWIEGRALETLLALRGLREGDLVKFDVAAIQQEYSERRPGGSQDPALWPDGVTHVVVENDEFTNHTTCCVWHPNYKRYYVGTRRIIAVQVAVPETPQPT